MPEGFFFALFAVVGALAIVAAKSLDDRERRRARDEARGRSSIPPKMTSQGGADSKPPPPRKSLPDEARSSGH